MAFPDLAEASQMQALELVKRVEVQWFHSLMTYRLIYFLI